jgi:hypothetical protein
MQKDYELVLDAFELRSELLNKVMNVTPKTQIFNPDEKRFQQRFFDSYLKSVANTLAQKFGFKYKSTSCVLLLSKPGCKQQQMHTDFNPQYESSKTKAGMIFSFMPDTRIVTMQGEIELPPRAVFIFRGNFPHAGAAYNTENRRVHFFYWSSAKAEDLPLESLSKQKKNHSQA